MGTLSTMGARVLRRLRDTGKNIWSEDDIVDATNEVIDLIHAELVSVESNLVYSHDTVTTSDGTAEYELASGTWIVIPHDGVWLDDETTYLQQVPEPARAGMDYEDDTDTGEPEYFYLTEDPKIGFLATPDDAYTVHVYYYLPASSFHVSTYDDDDLPFQGIWSQAIEQMVLSSLRELEELPASYRAQLASAAWDQAMHLTFARGVRRRITRHDMFEVDGV